MNDSQIESVQGVDIENRYSTIENGAKVAEDGRTT